MSASVLKASPGDIRWWFWLVTLVFIVATLAGRPAAALAVIAISALQIVFFALQERSLAAFPTQIRIVYFLFTLCGLSAMLRLPIYALLLVGTVMVTFFGRCAIALVLQRMPWNRGREVRLN